MIGAVEGEIQGYGVGYACGLGTMMPAEWPTLGRNPFLLIQLHFDQAPPLPWPN